MVQPSTASQSGAGEAEAEVQRLETLLMPGDIDDAMDALKPMFMLPRATPGDFGAFVATFRLVVSRYPLWAVKEASAAFIEGRVAAHTSEFCPQPPQLGRELAARVAPHQAKLSIARRRMEDVRLLAAEPVRIPRSEDARARGDALVKRLREEAEADRAKRNLAHRTGMTRAQIERERSRDGDSCG